MTIKRPPPKDLYPAKATTYDNFYHTGSITMAALRTALQASFRQQADDVETNRQGCENRPQDGAAAENEQQDPVAPEAKRITIFFEDLNQARMTFKLKPTTKFKKARNMWAENVQRDVQSLRLLFDGEKVLDDSTPESVSADDVIYAFLCA